MRYFKNFAVLCFVRFILFLLYPVYLFAVVLSKIVKRLSDFVKQYRRDNNI